MENVFMNDKITLESLSNAFYEKGEPCDYGCHQNDLDYVWNKVRGLPGYKSVFAVEDWMWLDIEMEGQQLMIIKANNVVRTNSRKFDIGDWVRTSPICRFTDDCICETFNSFYILVGHGSRKESDESIFYFTG